MAIKEDFKKALEELRKEKKKNFNQTVDLIINLKKYSFKKNPLNLLVNIPHKIKDKRICAFLEIKNKDVETIIESEFKRYIDKKELKKLVNNFDFFIAQASLMPKVATTFGRFLGPVGKMPSPQLGILMDANEKTISDIKNKINSNIKIRIKESSIKMAIGKEDMEDDYVVENIISVYEAVIKSLPREKDNIKNIEIKFTMSKPIKIFLK